MLIFDDLAIFIIGRQVSHSSVRIREQRHLTSDRSYVDIFFLTELDGANIGVQSGSNTVILVQCLVWT